MLTATVVRSHAPATDPVVCSLTRWTGWRLETEAVDGSRFSRSTKSQSPNLARCAPSRFLWSFLTSNNTRELSEALKRRCLYLYVGYPSVEREARHHPFARAGHFERARRADRPGRSLLANDRPEEEAVGL